MKLLKGERSSWISAAIGRESWVGTGEEGVVKGRETKFLVGDNVLCFFSLVLFLLFPLFCRGEEFCR